MDPALLYVALILITISFIIENCQYTIMAARQKTKISKE